MITRRAFLVTLLVQATVLYGCRPGSGDAATVAGSAKLSVRHRPPVRSVSPGRVALHLGGSERDGLLLVPTSYKADTPMPLVLALHGAGGSGAGQLGRLATYAEASGFLVVAPDSRSGTWDAIRGDYGPDVAFIDRALASVFEKANVDPSRIIVLGFSDGASYALGLGLANGDLFSSIVAFSPGFIPSRGEMAGKLPVFVSHGINDEILPIHRTSRMIVPYLESQGYAVTYQEFNGVHQIPPAVAEAAVKWMLERRR